MENEHARMPGTPLYSAASRGLKISSKLVAVEMVLWISYLDEPFGTGWVDQHTSLTAISDVDRYGDIRI